ncbi:uncharacterized protein A4U43_C08F24670 [Asparagus officinalis]|uniref:pentatricopeptide repeat-containing protein At3g29230-like n=1 Tax=Asparagus officinalis TaxID=4686 RepID=UPI00098DE5F2|nr:pentatricopeptide repeat-containing protein At3g29230-like [Asparagus officinalis]ONK60973.1 uncharacterized protein A4U43_C08F24670 [Asparagus officinalis]
MNKFVGQFSPCRQVEETLTSLISRCRAPSQIQRIQGRIITLGLHQNPYLSPKITSKFFELQRPALARQLFDQILHPNVVLWNVMLKGFSEAGLCSDALLLFNQMMKERRKDGFFVTPSAYTFTFVIKSCAFLSALSDGEQVHCFTIKTGWFRCNSFVGTTLIGMYSSSIDEARKVFEEMPIKDVVSQTAIIRAYVCAGDVDSARELFDRMVDRDVVLWNTMISGYTDQGDMRPARELFAQMPNHERDPMAWNTVLLGYANADGGLVDECERFFFEEMPGEKKNIFSWNGLIGVYSRHGRFSRTLVAFKQMLNCAVEPNDASMALVLSTCAKTGALSFGKGIHSYASKRHHGLLISLCVTNGLIDVYSKCGCIEDAKNLFHTMEKKTRDVVTWNSMINGLASHGHGIDAIELFEQMVNGENYRPDGITFVGVLSACVHSVGLVERGIAYFRSMVENYMIDPWIEHYGCVVDLLSRAGLVYEAFGLVRIMPMSLEPDCVIWSTILGACQQKLDEHGHKYEHQRQILIVAELAMSRLVRLEPEDVTHYVMLSKIYGACRRWADVARLKQVVHKMCNLEGNHRGLSWVQVDSHCHEFCSSDSRHSGTEVIYETLNTLRDMSIPAAIPEFASSS